MNTTLHWHTVDPELKKYLRLLMQAESFTPFRLVGGTALSLQLGHRQSVDIDLFSDAQYGSIDFNALRDWLAEQFPYVDAHQYGPAGMGKAFFIGESGDTSVKLDLFYTEPFIRPIIHAEGIRMAATEDIIAMKLEVISQGGRMKDFWDLHELLDHYSLEEMIVLHLEKYPYGHEEKNIRSRLTDFTRADDDFTPICHRGKHWELIKVDLLKAVEQQP